MTSPNPVKAQVDNLREVRKFSATGLFRLTSLVLPMLAVLLGAPFAHAQTIQIPAQQAKYCSIMSNWAERGGYAPGAVPKSDPNPIKAAQAPTPAGPGNFFDQLIEALGTSGTLTEWKGYVMFEVQGVQNAQSVFVTIEPYCPGAPGGYGERFSTDGKQNLPLDSPLAKSLSEIGNCTAAQGTGIARQAASCRIKNATFSGHFLYDSASRFYKTQRPNPRKSGLLSGSFLFVPINPMIIELTSISQNK